MQIADAQREMRISYAGTFYGQLVSGLVWLAAAALGTWGSPRASIMAIVIGGTFIFPVTKLLLRFVARLKDVCAENPLSMLGMQVAFVLPVSMPLLYPVAMYRLTLFYPGLMLLVGAHYLPFVFLYGMRMFWALAALLAGGGWFLATQGPASFSIGAWYTAVVLLVFAFIGRALLRAETAGARR